MRIRDRAGAVVKSYDVASEAGESVMNLLDRIRGTIDPSLAYYASCGTGKCGVCGVVADGTPRLACTCPALGDEIDLAPLPSGEFVRDLLTINPVNRREADHRDGEE